jgi:hypothetical protein
MTLDFGAKFPRLAGPLQVLISSTTARRQAKAALQATSLPWSLVNRNQTDVLASHKRPQQAHLDL